MAPPIEQLEAMRRLEENWDGYGGAAPQPKIIDLAQEFTRLIEALLWKGNANPGVLYVSPTRVGGILIEWEDPVIQHEVEFNPDFSISFLHLHKINGQINTRKLYPTVPTVVDPALLQELRQLLAA
jgi:hypothetical protein